MSESHEAPQGVSKQITLDGAQLRKSAAAGAAGHARRTASRSNGKDAT